MRNEEGYLQLLHEIIISGYDKIDRTGVGTRGFFGCQLHFDLQYQSFPLLTTKKVFFRAVVEELLWFLSGSTSVKPLQDKGITIWDEWATKEQCAKFDREEGDLGPVYGAQWRAFGGERMFYIDENRKTKERRINGIDQIARVIADIKKNPYSRRHIVTAWNPKEADEVALPPCHTLFQFHVMDERLSCHMYQRSADMFLGVPFNIASYALLTHMVASVCQLEANELIISYGDVHVYKNHFEQVKEQLSRAVRPPPVLRIISTGSSKVPDIDAFVPQNFELVGYDPHPAIKAEVAV